MCWSTRISKESGRRPGEDLDCRLLSRLGRLVETGLSRSGDVGDAAEGLVDMWCGNGFSGEE